MATSCSLGALKLRFENVQVMKSALKSSQNVNRRHDHVYDGAFKKTNYSNYFFQKQHRLIVEKSENVAKLKTCKTPLIPLISELPVNLLPNFFFIYKGTCLCRQKSITPTYIRRVIQYVMLWS